MDGSSHWLTISVDTAIEVDEQGNIVRDVAYPGSQPPENIWLLPDACRDMQTAFLQR